ncbi:hypothetical protein [Oceanobacillus manasiensis]|uniref:hypothetical protein n=1 Tax=Oceanobacillus manasiensis TaxID=586413 RepID=UPI0005A83909|nr:hypothetical protein [Oceanobacillus manasiensis]
MMPFLYFPEDKTEYIPAIITLIIFMIAASVVMYLFYKRSKKEEQVFNETYEQSLNEQQQNEEN